MDDATTEKTSSTSSTSQTKSATAYDHQDLVDDYPGYLGDALGYHFDARDTLTLAQLHRHDDLLHADPATLEAVKLAEIGDLDRWAVARAAQRRGDLDAFLEAARLVLAGELEHPAIAYDEVFHATIGAAIDGGRLDEAARLVEAFRDAWPEEPVVDLLEVRLAYRQGLDAGRARAHALAEANPDDGELRYELAEDLLAMGEVEEAGRWLDQAQAVAERIGDRPLQGDIALQRPRLQPTEAASTEG